MELTQDQIKEMIYTYLPEIIQKDIKIRNFIIEITKDKYPDKDRTEDRFDRMFDELKSLRIEHQDKWEKFQLIQDKKWEDFQLKQDKKWEDFQLKQDKKWEGFQLKQDKKWEGFQLKQDKKWEENKREFDRVHEEIMANAKKVDRSIGALGSRWGMKSEASFRNALAGILEMSFDVQVINVNEYDHDGKVFGHPDQVELDIIVKNGLLIICELKSSISKSDMYIFDRKVLFYETKHNRKASRKIVISPMINPGAEAVAKRLNIEVFSDSIDVKTL